MPSSLPRRTFGAFLGRQNVIKDDLLLLGLDTNHGFAKVAVENSEVAKRRTAWSNGEPASSNGHRVRANARPKPAGDESGSVLPTTHKAENCTVN
jgi:hypothetical protein